VESAQNGRWGKGWGMREELETPETWPLWAVVLVPMGVCFWFSSGGEPAEWKGRGASQKSLQTGKVGLRGWCGWLGVVGYGGYASHEKCDACRVFHVWQVL